MHPKIAKFGHRQFSTQHRRNTHPVHTVQKEVSPAGKPSEKNGVLSRQQTAGDAGGTIEEMQIVCEEREDSICTDAPLDAPLVNLSKNDSQTTCSLKLGKKIDGNTCKSTHEKNKSAVTLDQNGQLGKKITREKKEHVDNVSVFHGSVAVKDSKMSDSLMSLVSPQVKTSKHGSDDSRLHRRSSLDSKSSHPHRHRHRHHSHHHHGKPDSELISKNGEQLVPPLKIRVEHHQKSADHQSTVATYLVDSRCSENVRDDSKKTIDVKNSDAIPASEPTAHVADNKTEKEVIPATQDTFSKEGEKQTTSDPRRTRSGNAVRPVPLVKKRRLTFEESLIAGTCISTTSNSAITTDSVKNSVTAPSVSAETIDHSKQECAVSSAKLAATSLLKTSEKKEVSINDTRKTKLEEDRPVSVEHFSSSRKPSDEVKMKQSFPSNTFNVDSDHLKSLNHPVPMQKESKSYLAETKSVAQENKCDGKNDSGFSDSNTQCLKSSDSGIAKNEVGINKSSTEEGLATLAKEPPNYSVKNPSSDRTSRHHQHHNHHDHHLRHSGSSTKPHRMAGSRMDYELKRKQHSCSKYGSLMHIETHPNGGASVVHAYDDEFSTLSPRELSEFVREFFRVVFDEDPVGVPRYVIGIVHNSAAYLPDILEYFASVQPDMIVKRGYLGKSSDVETTTIGEYFQRVQSTYLAGTYRTGPLDHFSIVGTKAEETGGYFPQFLDLLDQNIFLKYVSPWGKISELENMPRNESNDGPIVWARPGEQVVPTADMPKSPMVKKRLVWFHHILHDLHFLVH